MLGYGILLRWAVVVLDVKERGAQLRLRAGRGLTLRGQGGQGGRCCRQLRVKVVLLLAFERVAQG